MALSQAIDQSAVARVMGILVSYEDLSGGQAFLLPQVVGVMGQGSDAVSYDDDKRQFSNALDVAEVYGFGSPLHLAAQKLKPESGVGGIGTIPMIIHPLEAAIGATVSTGELDGVGAQVGTNSYIVRINNYDSNAFVIADTESFADVAVAVAEAINAVLEMPVIALENTGVVEITSKWKGISANDIFIEVIGVESGITFAITQPVGGLINPDVDPALNLIGETWETLLLNCLNYSDVTTLDKIQVFGEDRWLPIIHKPLICFVGNNVTGESAITAITDTRKKDRVNSQVGVPGSRDLPFVTAAGILSKVAKQANNNPPVDYGSLEVTSIEPGPDADQLKYNQRDVVVKAGASTVTTRDGVVNIEDTVTMFHPTGQPNPAYRFVVDIIKEMQVVYNIALIFAGKPWDGAPLIPDSDATTNPEAKQPKDAVAALAAMTDALGLEAILSSPKTTKPLIRAEIGAPKRLDICYPHFLSGNANIISIDSKFSFFVGG